MSQAIGNFGKGSVEVNGLDTFTYTLTTAGPHKATVTVSALSGSGVTVVIKQNSTTLVTSSTPNPINGNLNVSIPLNGSISDVISFVIASSSAIDQAPNAVKANNTLKTQVP